MKTTFSEPETKKPEIEETDTRASGKSDAQIKNEIQACYQEAKSAFVTLLEYMKEDHEMYMTKQWKDAELALLRSKNMPALQINIVKKQVDLMSGFERQNKTDIRVFPVEGGDEYTAEVLTKCIKWVMKDRSHEFTRSDCFKDALKGGLGWLHSYLDYSNDPVNGDIVIKKISPFSILPDPHFVERDLSDCSYIIFHKMLHRDKVAQMFPKYAKQIQNMKGNPWNTDGIRLDTIVPMDQGDYLQVVEYWHREFEKRPFLINAMDPSDMMEWDGTEEDLQAMMEDDPSIIRVDKEVAVMKMACVVEMDLLVYNDYSPFGGKEYPFVPIFGFFESSYPTWDLKVQGVIRPLKDIQREKNKRRSNIMEAVMTQVSSGHFVEQNSVEDLGTLSQAGGAGKIVIYRPGKNPPTPIPPPQMPQALVQLEQMSDQDSYMVGANPDLMGALTERGAPGITIQLRQRQGQTALQEIFDSLSYASKMLGRLLVQYITGFSQTKIKRIMGDDFAFTAARKAILEQIENINNQIRQIIEAPLPKPDTPVQANDIEKRAVQMAPPGAKEVIQGEAIKRKQEADQKLIDEQNMEKMKMIEPLQLQIRNLKKQVQQVNDDEEKFWKDFEVIRQNSRFDCDVDEMANNQTYKSSILAMLSQAKQYGVVVPDEIFMQFMDLPKTAREAWKGYIDSQRELQMQKAKAEQAVAEAQMAKTNAELQIAQLKSQTDIKVAQIQADSAMKTTVADNVAKIQVQEIKERSEAMDKAVRITEGREERKYKYGINGKEEQAPGQMEPQEEPEEAQATEEPAPEQMQEATQEAPAEGAM